MRIKYLGTAAFEGVPAMFCNCRVCRESFEKGGRNLRSRSQALINDELLIEFNADTVWHFQKYHLDWNKINSCIITHSHSDHLYPDDLEMAGIPFSHQHQPLHLYLSQKGYQKVQPIINRDYMNHQVVAHQIKANEAFETIDHKYSILPFQADHDLQTDPVIYVISDHEKNLLYAHDTGYFPEVTWKALSKLKHLDYISFDCTGCLDEGWINNHMSLPTILKVIARLKEMELIDDSTILCANHFSHNGGSTYDEMVEKAKQHHIIISYDGMSVDF